MSQMRICDLLSVFRRARAMTTEYSLSKHRYYELRHFCQQYPEWKELYFQADGWSGKGDTTSRDGITRAQMAKYMKLIELCANLTNRDILPFVTGQERSLPAELRYDYYRFFWELSRRR